MFRGFNERRFKETLTFLASHGISVSSYCALPLKAPLAKVDRGKVDAFMAQATSDLLEIRTAV